MVELELVQRAFLRNTENGIAKKNQIIPQYSPIIAYGRISARKSKAPRMTAIFKVDLGCMSFSTFE
jgi:hypothetical protein